MIKMSAYKHALINIRQLVGRALEKLLGHFSQFDGHVAFITRMTWQDDTFVGDVIKIQFNADDAADIDVNIFGFPHGVSGKQFTDDERVEELVYAIECVFENPGKQFRLFYDATRYRKLDDATQCFLA
jgi:hypothetical protein